ncbi:MAG: LytTR family DNA-binding domain-containing protein, partial [Oscillospiraceae bacterium]|nr:LytTR family DNA-binding domain-containing protein [Oscillospiraceae bacterium]
LESGHGFDVVFLDIRMEQPDGMETARLLRRRNSGSLLIFVTVLRECVFDAFAVDAFDYLVKPLDGSRFRQAMDRALKTLEQRAAKSLVIQRGAACEVVPLAQIEYCEVQGRKIYIHQSGGAVIDYYDRLEALERRLDGRFFRCHRSYLVNLAYIRGYGGGLVTLAKGGTVPVSRTRGRELTLALLRYMKEGNDGLL